MDPDIVKWLLDSKVLVVSDIENIQEQLESDRHNPHLIRIAIDSSPPKVRRDVYLKVLGKPIYGSLDRLRERGFLNPDDSIKEIVVEAEYDYASFIKSILDDNEHWSWLWRFKKI